MSDDDPLKNIYNAIAAIDDRLRVLEAGRRSTVWISDAVNTAAQDDAVMCWAVVAPAIDVPGQWVARCNQLEVVSQGNTPQHAFAMLCEAVRITRDDERMPVLDVSHLGSIERTLEAIARKLGAL